MAKEHSQLRAASFREPHTLAFLASDYVSPECPAQGQQGAAWRRYLVWLERLGSSDSDPVAFQGGAGLPPSQAEEIMHLVQLGKPRHRDCQGPARVAQLIGPNHEERQAPSTQAGLCLLLPPPGFPAPAAP